MCGLEGFQFIAEVVLEVPFLRGVEGEFEADKKFGGVQLKAYLLAAISKANKHCIVSSWS